MRIDKGDFRSAFLFYPSTFYSQFALLAPLDVLGGLLFDGRLVLFLPEPDRHEDVVGAVLALDVEAAGLLN